MVNISLGRLIDPASLAIPDSPFTIPPHSRPGHDEQRNPIALDYSRAEVIILYGSRGARNKTRLAETEPGLPGQNRDRGKRELQGCLRSLAESTMKRKAFLSNDFNSKMRTVSTNGTRDSIAETPCFSGVLCKKCQMHDTSENKKITKRTHLKVSLQWPDRPRSPKPTPDRLTHRCYILECNGASYCHQDAKRRRRTAIR